MHSLEDYGGGEVINLVANLKVKFGGVCVNSKLRILHTLSQQQYCSFIPALSHSFLPKSVEGRHGAAAAAVLLPATLLQRCGTLKIELLLLLLPGRWTRKD